MDASPVFVSGLSVTPRPYVEDLVVGESITWEETYSQVYTWFVCLLHWDFNPIHWNVLHARKTRFRRTIVHAISVWARISRHLAESYPGVAWISFRADMLGPVFHGMVVTFTATVTHVEGNKASVEVHASVNGEQVLRTDSKIGSKKKTS